MYVSSGIIQSVSVDIPWMSLMTDNCKVSINGISLEVKFQSPQDHPINGGESLVYNIAYIRMYQNAIQYSVHTIYVLETQCVSLPSFSNASHRSSYLYTYVAQWRRREVEGENSCILI